MNVYMCKICADPYVGNTKPSNCPHCGAPAKYIILAENYVEQPAPKLTDIERENLESALKMEIENVQFYRCAVNLSEDDPMAKAMFRALADIETEHAEVACELLSRPAPVIEDSDACALGSHEEHLHQALDREKEAVDFYVTAADSSTDSQVKEFFEALVEIEEDHISLSNLGLGIA